MIKFLVIVQYVKNQHISISFKYPLLILMHEVFVCKSKPALVYKLCLHK